jgi:DNA-binding transcriptional LysR family regulator
MTFELRPLGARADEALDISELDFLIAPPADDLDMHRTEVLFEDTFTCVAWIGNELVGETMTPDEYLNLGHVIVNVGGSPVGNIDEVYLRKNKRRRRIEITAPSFAQAAQLVVGTDRITTIPMRLALRSAESMPLKMVPLPIEIPRLVETLHWHRAHDQDPAHTWFRSILKDVVAAMPSVPDNAGTILAASR